MKDVRLVDLMDVKALQKIQDEIDFDIHISKDAPPKLLGDAGRIGQVVRVSINLSRRHLRNQKTLSNILEIIDKYDIPHEYIEIELTETTMDQNFDRPLPVEEFEEKLIYEQ